MAVKVETFECTESDAAELKIIEKMGLEGQGSLVPDRYSYHEMDHNEKFAYYSLCPNRHKLESYSASQIPLVVLEFASQASERADFEAFYVWHGAELEGVGNLLVGIRQHDRYILARWGEELDAFETLLDKAVDLKKKQLVDAITSIETTVAMRKAHIESMTRDIIIKVGTRAAVRFEVYNLDEE